MTEAHNIGEAEAEVSSEEVEEEGEEEEKLEEEAASDSEEIEKNDNRKVRFAETFEQREELKNDEKTPTEEEPKTE